MAATKNLRGSEAVRALERLAEIADPLGTDRRRCAAVQFQRYGESHLAGDPIRSVRKSRITPGMLSGVRPFWAIGNRGSIELG